MIDAVLRALGMAFAMGWQILWPLVLGFALSAVVQAVVSHREMAGSCLTTGRARLQWLSPSEQCRRLALMRPWRLPARCSARVL